MLLTENLAKLLAPLVELGEEEIKKLLTTPEKREHGDLSFPCFAIAKKWKLPPPQCAAKVKELLGPTPGGFSRVEIVGGYLNFFVDQGSEVVRVLSEHHTATAPTPPSGPRVIIEYSSPNIAKPYHIGHLRNVLIGAALDRLHRFLGYNVVSINHLGDWGTQFGFVYVGAKCFGMGANPSVEDLLTAYRAGSALRRAQDEKRVPPDQAHLPNANEMAREYFLRLEANDPEAVTFWQVACDVSIAWFKGLDRRLGVSFDHYTGESFYRDKLADVEEMIRRSGVLENSEGALGVNLGKELGFVRIFTEDGRSLYITRDIAAADYRERTFAPQKILYVVGAPQSLHFRQLIGVMERLNHPVASKIVHVAFGHVPGISTRKSSAADRISLEDLLNDGAERALDAYRTQVEKRPEGVDELAVAERVGIGAIAFEYLSRTNIKDFHFDWDAALQFQGDTGPYLQYAHARISSIAAKARAEGILPAEVVRGELLTGDGCYNLVALLREFRPTLRAVAERLEPVQIATYLLELAKGFSSVYKTLRVVGEEREVAAQRLRLFVEVQRTLKAGMEILGIPAIERM